ncbi:SDR family oxidoreductase [Candidatus Levibacter sp. Uisw_134_01]|jgi:NAD(P)-dependent dehydrogenase (short-subunit alcohol dehydrogenase family)|uniref:SDR family oxidoreductase n=1 Tax=Candidatus Levibacter sp. Uisw_134_01 TaxID=3230999 RepID=UPI003D388D46|tara:strand:+ start:84 stop:866 length:783 start_codon:yes stop_codon:yes gene_type:complete
MENLFNLNGKIALVTGGSRGIGAMIAEGFVRNGVKTYISSRKSDPCDKKAKELSKYGECISIPADLTDMNEMDKLVTKIKDKETKLNILVNNAGAAWGASFDDFPEIGWDKVMDTNVKSVFFLTQKLVDILETSASTSDPSRIINIGSIDGLGIPRAETYSYPASKAAVHQLTKVLANRLANRNINVNAIAPGPFESNMMAHTLEEYGEQIKSSVPRGRIGVPEDMAGASIFLSSKASSYITGSIIPVDGGSLIARRHME